MATRVSRRHFFPFRKNLLLSEELSKAAKDATEATGVALAVARGATQEDAQHACQTCGIDAIALLSLTQQGEEAGGDGGEDATHEVGAHACVLRDAVEHGGEVAADDRNVV